MCDNQNIEISTRVRVDYNLNEQLDIEDDKSIILTSFLPLLYFNFRAKNKIFLGDSGSLFLGGIVSIYILNILIFP